MGRKTNYKEISMKRKYFAWTPEATKCFLDVWETNLKSLRGTRKKNLEQKDMAEDLKLRNFGVTRIELKAKLQVMTRRYRLEALEFSKTGVRPKWEYFQRLRRMFERDYDDFGDVSEETENTETESAQKQRNYIFTDKTIPVSDHESSSDEFEFSEPASKFLRHQLDTKVKDYHYRRVIDLEEEKLAIQKENLVVMRSMAKDLSNMHATFLDAFGMSLPNT